MSIARTNTIGSMEGFRYQIMELEDRYRKQVLAMAVTLVSLVDLRDSYTGGHSGRVASYARAIGLHLGLQDSQLDNVVMAALMHDIGKIGVPDHVLLKPGKLTDEEFAHIRKHPELGWMALKNIDDFKSISLIVLHHHERMDGRGYPGGLEGAAIPLGARIIAVADSYDALTTNRPYRPARTRQQAVDELLSCSESQFDPRVLSAFLDSLDEMKHEG
jgi:HD-GYP domain-containing protein (c-di-GMP phosphodiesterase class II)